MIRRIFAPTVVLIVLIVGLAAQATGGGYDPCDEYHESRHPECTTTTTNYETTTTYSQSTTTEPEVTTTQPETTTTVVQTTTTVQECADGLLHLPPLCVNPTTVPDVQVSSTVVSAAPTVLPHTGISSSMLAAASSLSLVAGLAVLGLRRRIV